MPGLKLWLLGPPRVELDGKVLELPRRKSLALLVYLVLTGEAQPRDRLAALFFPEYDATGARSALRRDLSALNAALGPGWLEAGRETIGFRRGPATAGGRPPGCWLDIEAFRGLLAAPATHGHAVGEICVDCLPVLSEAAGLYRGDFLAGFTLRDSAEFDEWQFFQGESLRQELASALERLVNGYIAVGEAGGAPGIPYARQWVALDLLHEPAHRALMRLYAGTGRSAAALRQYAECARVLDAELGVPPAEETTRLYEAIKGQRLLSESRGTGVMAPQLTTTRSPAAGILPSPSSVSGLEDAGPAGVSTFVGHESELGRLDSYLNAALEGLGRAVFVVGEPGSGKTSLAQEFARRSQIRQPRLVVARGNCNAYTGLGDPYLPFREILAQLTGAAETDYPPDNAGLIAQRMRSFAPLAIRVLVETGPDLLDTFIPKRTLINRAKALAREGGWPDGLEQLIGAQETRQSASSVKQSDLFAQYLQVVQMLAGQQPLLLILDDLQWADMGSTNLLFHLGRHLLGNRVLVVGLYRSAEVALGRTSSVRRVEDGTLAAERERHPLESLLHEFQQLFGDIVVDLAQSADIRFIDAFLNAHPSVLGPGFREALFRHTGGHALFTVEMFRGLQERGDIVKDGQGRWVEARQLNWEILPARVEGAVGERIGRLPPQLRDILKVASVEGEIFTAEIVARVQQIDERAVVQILGGELDRQHRLVRNESSRRLGPDDRQVSQYRFRHILFQRYLYNELDAAECSYLHEAVALALERLHGQDSETVAVHLARHFEAAGWTAKAVHYLKLAGERAVRLSANEEALVHFGKALQLLAALPPDDATLRLELDLQIALFTPLSAIKSYGAPEVGQAYSRARELCLQIDDPQLLFQVLYGLWGHNLVRMNLAIAEDLARECLALAGDSQNRSLLLEAHRMVGETAYHRGEVVKAREHLERSRAIYDFSEHRAHAALYGQDPGVALLSHGSWALWHLGYPDQARAWSEEAVRLADAVAHPFSQVFALEYASILDQLQGDLKAAELHAKAAIAIAGEQKFGFWLSKAKASLGWLAVEKGDLAGGIAGIQENLSAYRSPGQELVVPYHLICLARAHARSGDIETALASLDEGFAVAERSAGRLWEAELHRVKGETLLLGLRGSEPAAEDCFRKALAIAREQEARSLELRAAMSLCRLWADAGRRAEARTLLDETLAWFTEGFDTSDLREATALLAMLV